MNNLTEEKIKYFVYCRKSSESEDKQALSLSSQIEEAEKIKKNNDLLVIGDPFNEARSAKSAGRSVFNDMVSRIEKGEASGIICWKLDRLARNFVDGGKIIDLLQRGIIKKIWTPNGIYLPSDNVLTLAVEFGMANQYVRDLSVNVKRGLERKSKMGYPNGIAHIGYLNDKTEEKGNRGWYEDELRFPLIKQLFEKYLTGMYSVSQLWEIAKNDLQITTPQRKREGGKPISLSYMYVLFSNPVYAGFFYAKDQQGVIQKYKLNKKLKRIISEQDYWKIQMMLGKKGRPRPQKRQALYNHFLRDGLNGCATTADHKFQIICSNCKNKFSYANREDCPNCSIKIENMKNPKYLNYIFYYSLKEKKDRNIRAKGIEERKIEIYLKNIIKEDFSASQELSDWCIKHIDVIKDKELEDQKSVLVAQEKSQEDSKKQLLELMRMRSRNLISEEEFLFMKKDINLIIKSNSKKDMDWGKEAENIFSLTPLLFNVIENEGLQEKKEILFEFGANLTLNRGKLNIHHRKSVSAFISGIKKAKAINRAFEPKKTLADKDKTEVFASVYPSLLRGQDSNLRPND